jgi:fructokinase
MPDNAAMKLRIGIDLGGTKIEGLALAADGRELGRRRVATPQGDYPATLRAVVGLVRELEAACGGPARIGIGTPGSLSPTSGRMRNANSTCLNGQPLDRDLAALLDRPLRIANDADCFALSEATDGAAAGARSVFGVIIGTGTGAGVVVDGRLLDGANRIAGEWGHNPLPWPRPDELPGPACYCGKQGCIETFLSGPGLSQAFAASSGESLQPPAIAARAEAGDPAAEAVLRSYEDRLARGLASIINVLDPEVIVLGGGMSNLARLYPAVPRQWARYVFSDEVNTRLLPPRHGDASGVRGAAWLWPA